jgi:hypothetical protein
MTNKPNKMPTPVAGQPDRLPPVRVKLWETDGRVTKVHPPDGEKQILRQRLNKALGTMSFDFVNASLFDLQGVTRTPFGRISENRLNAALAMIEAAAPKNEIEGALAVQMACTHAVAMTLLVKMETHFGSERQIAACPASAPVRQI